VEKTRKEKQKVRERTFIAERSGLKFKLPSHWAEMGLHEKQEQFLRTLGTIDEKAVIGIQVVDGDPRDPKLEGLGKEMKKRFPDVKAEKVSCPLGGGVAFTFSTKNESGKPIRIRAEYYPQESKLVVFRLLGAPKAFSAALSEFKKARATLRP
jgi:hypothetical protein